MADTAVHVGEGNTKNKRPVWQFVLLLIVVIVLAGGAGLGLRWLQEYRQHKLAAKPNAVQAAAEEAQNIAAGGNYNKALKAIDQALDNPQLSSDGKYTLLFQQGVTYENKQNYDAAIKSYKDAEAIQQTQAVAEAIARTAVAKGDKELAIAYYKKAITLIDANRPTAGDTQKYYEQLITELGGQP